MYHRSFSAVIYPFDASRRCARYCAFLVTFHRAIVFPLDDFSFVMDVEVALPSGNIGDEPEVCGNTLEDYTCAAPEYLNGTKGVVVGVEAGCVCGGGGV
jgi:hypothetical protein